MRLDLTSHAVVGGTRLPARSLTVGALVLLLLWGTASVAVGGPRGPEAGLAPPPARPAGLPPMPLLFQPNRGQADAPATFVGDGPGLRLSIAGAHATLDFGSGVGLLRVRMIGARHQPRAVGEQPQRTRVNYYTGSKRPIVGVPTYGRVRIAEAYPGIDVVYYGNTDRLEYDFVVAPGADPAPIRFALEGARSVVESGGALRIALPGRTIELEAPVAFQERDGRREPVEVRYRVARGDVSLVLGAYDRTRPLVVDPAFDYATYLGGAGDDTASRVAVDGDGSAYIIGTTKSPSFPPAIPTGPQPGATTSVAFLVKLDPSGGFVEYLSYWGNQFDRPYDVAVDANRNVFVGGQTWDASGGLLLPGGFSAAPANTVTTEGYLLRFDEFGVLAYGTYVGGVSTDGVYSVDTDGTGTAWVAGYTHSAGPSNGQAWTPGSTRFPIRGDTYQTEKPTVAGSDGFVVKIDTNATGDASLLLGTFVGGNPVHAVRAIDVDGAGFVYVAGTTSGTGWEFGVGMGEGFKTTPESSEAFLAKFDPGLQVRLYGTYIGGSGAENDVPDEGFSLAVNDTGHAWVAGGTRSADFYTTPNALKGELTGGVPYPYAPGRDGFLVRIDTTQTGMASLVYSTLFGGNGDEYVYDLAVDPGGNAYVVGPVFSTPSSPPNFPTSPCTIQAEPGNSSANGWDGYLLRVGPAGTRQFVYATFVGGAAYEEARGVALGAAGRAYIVGRTASTAFPATPGAFQTTKLGTFDGFVAKVDTRCAGVSDLSVTYSGPDVSPPGQPVTYTAVVTNAGPDPAWNAALLLYWPATANGIQASDAGCLKAGPTSAYFVCELALAVGESQTITFTFIPHGAGDVTSGASITPGSWGHQDPDDSNDMVYATLAVREPAADLRVTYSGPTGPMVTGQPLTYTAMVTNLGPDPSDVTLIQYRPDPSIDATASDPGCQVTGSRTMVCAIGVLAPNERRGVRFTFTPQGIGDVWTSVAAIEVSPHDPDPSNNDALLTLTLREPTADVQVTYTGPSGTMATGQPLTYTAVVTNLGPDPTNVKVIQYRPNPSTGMTASDAGCDVGQAWSPTVALIATTCDIAVLLAGESRTMSFTFTPQGTGIVSTGIHTVTSAQSTVDPVASNNSVWLTLTLMHAGANLAITSVASTASPAPYVPFTITFNVSNTGPQTATNVLVSAKLTGLKFVKNQASGCISKNGGHVTCPTFTLASGASKATAIQVVSILPGTYVTTFAVAAAEPDPVMTNNAGTVSVTTPPNADLSMNLAVTPNPATVGQPITYSMVVANAGPSVTTNVTATLAFNNGLFIPGALTFVSAAPGCVLQAPQRQVVCTTPTLGSGASQTFTVTVTSAQAMTLGTIASVTAAETDVVPQNNAKSGLLVIAPLDSEG